MQGGLEEIPQSFLKLIEGMLANNIQDRMTIDQVMASEWYNEQIPDEASVHETMNTRKREVEARIKAEKQAKKEQKASKKKSYNHRGVGEDEEEAFDDEDSLAIMAQIKTHDQRIRNLGINTLLFTAKHPLQMEEEFENLTADWPMFEFDKKKPFRYNLHVVIDRPKVEYASDDEGEEESKGQVGEKTTEEIKVGLRCDVTAVEGGDKKFALEFTRLQEEGEERAISSMDFYKGFQMITEIFQDIAEEDDE